MIKKSLISIILPVYNGSRYLRESIESCLNQTYKDLELIIVDDCSTDSSLKIANEYSTLDNRVHVISNKINKNLPASLNIGHRIAKGKYLTWTSDDNILKKNMLDSLLSAIKKTGSDLVFSDYDIIEQDGSFRRTHSIGPVCSLPFGNSIGASFLYRHDVFINLKGYDESLHTLEDYDFWLRAALKYRFFHLRKSLYNYRVHQENLTSTILKNKSFQHSFHDKHRITYDKLLYQLRWSEKTKEFLLMVKKFYKWDWNLFKNHYEEIIGDLKKFQKSIKSNDSQVVSEILNTTLRNNIIKNCSDRYLLLWLIYKRPGIIFNLKYSKKKTLKILKIMF